MLRILFFVLTLVINGTSGAFAANSVDLKVESIQVQPPRVTTESDIVVVPTIRNLGSDESERFYVSVTVKKGRKTLKTIPGVPVLGNLPRNGSGLSVPIEIGILPEGEYEVVIVADSEGSIKERNEKNNILKKEFRVWAPSYRIQTYGYNY